MSNYLVQLSALALPQSIHYQKVYPSGSAHKKRSVWHATLDLIAKIYLCAEFSENHGGTLKLAERELFLLVFIIK